MRFESKNLEAFWVDPVAYPLKGGSAYRREASVP